MFKASARQHGMKKRNSFMSYVGLPTNTTLMKEDSQTPLTAG